MLRSSRSYILTTLGQMHCAEISTSVCQHPSTAHQIRTVLMDRRNNVLFPWKECNFPRIVLRCFTMSRSWKTIEGYNKTILFSIGSYWRETTQVTALEPWYGMSETEAKRKLKQVQIPTQTVSNRCWVSPEDNIRSQAMQCNRMRFVRQDGGKLGGGTLQYSTLVDDSFSTTKEVLELQNF